MPQIDIELPASLREALALPACADLRLPPPSVLKISLPTGGSLPAIADFTRGIPDDCTLSFSLLAQLGPFLGAFECLFRVLNLIAPLVEVVTGLTKVPPKPPVEAIQKMAEAIPPVLECVAKIVPQIGIIPFVRDVLALIAKLLRCALDQLESIAAILSGFALRIQEATAAGNRELAAALECAQANAALSAAHVMSSLEALRTLLALMSVFLSIAGVGAVSIPQLGSPESAEAINAAVATLRPIAVTVETLARALGAP